MNAQRPMQGKWLAFPITLIVMLSWIMGPILVGVVKSFTNANTATQILSVIAAFLLFLNGGIVLTLVGAYVAAGKRNLPFPEELADGNYKIIDDFRSWGRHYYKVRRPDNSDVLLIESTWMLPPSETRPLTPGSFRHPHRDTDRFEVKKGQLFPTYSGRIT